MAKRVKPYHGKGFPIGDPPPLHWTLPIQTSLSCVSWADIRHCLQGEFSTNLKGQIDQLQLELHQQLSDIKCHTEQKVFQTLHDNLQWLNPKNWFDGLNLQVWVMAALVCLLVLILIVPYDVYRGHFLEVVFRDSK